MLSDETIIRVMKLINGGLKCSDICRLAEVSESGYSTILHIKTKRMQEIASRIGYPAQAESVTASQAERAILKHIAAENGITVTEIANKTNLSRKSADLKLQELSRNGKVKVKKQTDGSKLYFRQSSFSVPDVMRVLAGARLS